MSSCRGRENARRRRDDVGAPTWRAGAAVARREGAQARSALSSAAHAVASRLAVSIWVVGDVRREVKAPRPAAS
jgi:hypothetical protein